MRRGWGAYVSGATRRKRIRKQVVRAALSSHLVQAHREEQCVVDVSGLQHLKAEGLAAVSSEDPCKPPWRSATSAFGGFPLRVVALRAQTLQRRTI